MTITDTPIDQPPHAADLTKAFIGDLARPFALIALALSCAVCLAVPYVGADKLGLALTALGAMYGAKAWENASAARSAQAPAVAQANASAPAATVVTPVVVAPTLPAATSA